MSRFDGLKKPARPDWRGLIGNILRKGTPDRAYHMELFHDAEIRDAIVERFDLLKGVSPNDPDLERKKLIAANRFCGWDYAVVGLADIGLSFHRVRTEDTAGLKRAGGRYFQDEHTGPIMSWADFEKYPWPDPAKPACTRDLEWFSRNLPDDMCIVGGLTGHFAEEVTWLMGYETLCYALYDQRDLVQGICDKLIEHYRKCVEILLRFDRVKMIWASDDMGYKTGLLISAKDMRQFVLRGHKVLAEMTHAAGRPYLLHACGKLTDIIDDLTDDVKIDAKHSFEDTIEDVRQVKHTYGRKIAMIGGIDVDFLCRSSQKAIRKRVRDTLDVCLPGGGYCLGTGNTVANYIPLDNYLAMVDEGR
jgi:uroporphyrinogen decarboxylase